jgi:hypothetical protein
MKERMMTITKPARDLIEPLLSITIRTEERSE